MRRRYKTSSPCVNGARLLRTAGELSGSAIQGPFGVFASITLPAVRVDLLSVEEVTFEGSDHQGREDHRDRQDCQDHLDREDHQELPGSPMNVLLSSGSAESLVGMKKVLPGCRKSRRDASTAS